MPRRGVVCQVAPPSAVAATITVWRLAVLSLPTTRRTHASESWKSAVRIPSARSTVVQCRPPSVVRTTLVPMASAAPPAGGPASPHPAAPLTMRTLTRADAVEPLDFAEGRGWTFADPGMVQPAAGRSTMITLMFASVWRSTPVQRTRAASVTQQLDTRRGPIESRRGPEEEPHMTVSVGNSKVVYDAMKGVGVRLVSALPETWLVHLIRMADEDLQMTLVRLAKEEEGVGVSAGAHLAGVKSAMLMQNHGFLQAINGIVSCAQLYRIPLLMLISDRGGFGERDPWQTEGGGVTAHVLEALRIPVDRLDSPDQVGARLKKAETLASSANRP